MLIEDWLQAVNQPAVDDITDKIKEILDLISDGGNFDKEQCIKILIFIILEME